MARCGQVIELLKRHQLAWCQQVNSSLIGVHPENRDGSGISMNHVHRLCSEFCELGFSNDLTNNVAVEVAPGDSSCLNFNSKLALEAGGKLPPAEAIGMLRYGSVSGSHSNMVMRMFLYNVHHEDERLTCGGRLSIEKIKLEDPAFAEAIEVGMRWTVISHVVITNFPRLPLLLQAAANSQNQVAQTESQRTSNRMKRDFIFCSLYVVYMFCVY